MKPEQLRKALEELSGKRDAVFAFSGVEDDASYLNIPNAMLVPDEPDHLVKLTDGQSIYIIDAERVCWVRIGMNDAPTRPTGGRISIR